MLRRPGQATLIFAITAIIFLASPVRVPTDSRYSTLVSEGLLRHGSLALDPWFARRTGLPYQVEVVRGHVYSWYPPAGPILAAPLVGVLALCGLSAGHDGRYDETHDVVVQALLAALLMAALAALFSKTAQAILPQPWSWIVALGGALGTQVWSTASRALWGDTFLTLILGAVVGLLVLNETGRRRLSAPLLATLLSWGYFARPPASIAVIAVGLYLLLYHRRQVPAYLITGAAWLGAFVLWSWLTFGTLLPTYYWTNTLSAPGFGTRLLGILVSPSRGQFVFVPVTAFVAYLLVRYRHSLPLPRMLVPALVAVVGQLALIAAFPLWHGGHSYGPRYLTPLVPWLVLLATLGLRALLDCGARGRRIELCAGALLLACSVIVQARGAWVRETWMWNFEPDNVSLHPERVWSWRQPQVLAGLVRPPLPETAPRLVPGTRLDFASPQAELYLLSGWSGPEGTFRWTDGRAAELVFTLDDAAPMVLEMDLEAFLPPRRVREQRVRIELNGATVAMVRVSRRGVVPIAVTLPPTEPARVNRLTLGLPDAAFASPLGLGKDPRQLGVAVHELRLRRATGPPRAQPDALIGAAGEVADADPEHRVGEENRKRHDVLDHALDEDPDHQEDEHQGQAIARRDVGVNEMREGRDDPEKQDETDPAEVRQLGEVQVMGRLPVNRQIQ